jgi:uncharacterized protein YndB with AHSA1/START domain
MGGERTGVVHFAVPAETAFDYLADPAHRPAWQSTLRRVEDVEGEPGVGQTWTDVTKPGMRPRMRTTEHVRPARWTETGHWRFVDAHLTLRFEPAGDGCDVHYGFRVEMLGPVGSLVTRFSGPTVATDLRRAARILAGR